MHIVFSRCPGTWGTGSTAGLPEAAAGQRILRAPDKSSRWLQVYPLRPPPKDLEAWIKDCLASNLPEGAELEVLEEQSGQSETGWPMRLYLTEVWPPKATHPTAWPEIRVHAFYQFRDYSGHAVAVSSAGGTDEDVQELMDILASARPDSDSPDLAAGPALGENMTDDRQPPPSTPTKEDSSLEAELEAARQAVAQAPGSAPAHERLGNLLAEQDPSEAQRCWERAVALDPGSVDAHYNLGQHNQLHQDAAAQRAHFEKAHLLAPEDPQILQKVIQSCMRLSQYEEAQRYRGQLLKLLGGSPQPPRSITIDQFSTAAGERCFVLEPLAADSDLRYLYVFQFTKDGRVLGTVNLETSDFLRGRGIYAILGMDRGDMHTTFQLSWSTPPDYPDMKEAALAAWRGEVPVGYQSRRA